MLYASAAAAATFNLICSGTLTTESFYSKESKPYRYEYRIDLEQKKWCSEDCKVIREIADVQPTRLVLEPPQDVNTVTEKKFSSGYIDRETGRHSVFASSGRRADIIMLNWEGQCEKAPFTGFPAFETKF